jgi:hypothetical protein
LEFIFIIFLNFCILGSASVAALLCFRVPVAVELDDPQFRFICKRITDFGTTVRNSGKAVFNDDRSFPEFPEVGWKEHAVPVLHKVKGRDAHKKFIGFNLAGWRKYLGMTPFTPVEGNQLLIWGPLDVPIMPPRVLPRPAMKSPTVPVAFPNMESPDEPVSVRPPRPAAPSFANVSFEVDEDDDEGEEVGAEVSQLNRDLFGTNPAFDVEKNKYIGDMSSQEASPQASSSSSSSVRFSPAGMIGVRGHESSSSSSGIAAGGGGGDVIPRDIDLVFDAVTEDKRQWSTELGWAGDVDELAAWSLDTEGRVVRYFFM